MTPKSAPQPGTSNPSSKSDTLVEPQPESQLVQTENRQLPQTGSEQAKGLMALGIASLLTNFGLGMKKKKNI
ncbi:MAG: LPXTG cell wall anchor domain-containing protein [Limosilactobacillus vaginalis]|uniref:LPXTG cell wall anchor domain-containing protein n=1 Tax=Limosilactobacillus vaginalis TaxID=1633 RepID=UPI0024B97818|nr:LPXTG cell wall anchor domain-containing protein [Limosilactobacillus vaginalis]